MGGCAGPIATHLHRVQGVAHSNTADAWKETRARGEDSRSSPPLVQCLIDGRATPFCKRGSGGSES